MKLPGNVRAYEFAIPFRFRADGATRVFPSGSWILVYSTGERFAVTANEFNQHWRPLAG